jgi:hypothetical protein
MSWFSMNIVDESPFLEKFMYSNDRACIPS